MIAFDLDGVICPDLPTNRLTEDEIWNVRAKIKPLFNPSYDFYIITGRAANGRFLTEMWIKEFEINCKKLFHENILGCNYSAQYKALEIFQNPEIDIFVESCKVQCQIIETLMKANCRELKVICFSEFIEGALRG